MINNKENGYSTIYEVIKLGVKGAPLYITLYAAFLLLQSAAQFLILNYERIFLDSLAFLPNGELYLKKTVVFLIILVAVRLFITILDSAITIVNYNYAFHFNLYSRNCLIDKVKKLNLIEFEDAELYQDFEKGGIDAPYQSCLIIESFLRLFFGSFFTIAIATGYLINLDPLLIFIILLTIAPKIFSFFLQGRWQQQLIDFSTPLKREATYYGKCISDIEYYKETRLLGSYSFFLNLFTEAFKKLNKEALKFNSKIFCNNIAISFMDILCFTGSFSVAIYLLFKGNISFGGFGAALTAITVTISSIDQFLKEINAIIKNLVSAQYVINILKREERGGLEKNIPQGDIVLDNISFRYPSAKRDSISKFSLTIKKGETVAIVGINGAGKTTLTKLILGLLQPYTGAIRIGDENTTPVNEYSLYKNSSAVFQNFGRYKVTIGENITFDEGSNEEQRQAVLDVLECIGFRMEGRPITKDDLLTSLGREYGGTDLSGGQWQQIAIARGLYKIHDIIILDEPTAAIDPIKEAQIYKIFMELCRNKTGIIVTHRLGSVSIANRIIIMEDGKLMESGDHESLIEKGGIYKDMFMRQAHWYERET